MYLKRCGLAVGLGLLAGCVDTETRSDTTADTADTETSNEVEPGAVEIVGFSSDFAIVTRGTDFRGRPVEGAARLSWETRGASGIELLVDGVKVALDACEPGDCVAQGSLVVRPTKQSTFTLRALGDCEGPCPEATVALDVRPPIGLTFTPRSTVVQPGEDVVVDYAVTHQVEFAVGLVDLSGPTLVPCVAEGQDGPCTVTTNDGDVATEGTLWVHEVNRRQVLGVQAKNGADDGLGDVGPATFFVEVAVPVVIEQFELVPERALPGDDVVVSWRVAGAQAVSVEAGAADLGGLTTCIGLGEDGAGFCTVKLAPSAPLVPVEFVLRGEQVGGELGEAQARLEVIGGPQIAELGLSHRIAVPGQTITLSWTAFGAETVSWQATPAVIEGLEGCTELAASGRGSCVVRVGAAADGDIALTMTASHGAVGPAATSQATLGIMDAPEVVRFEVDDDTVEPGTTITLNWEVAHADEVLLGERSGVVAPTELARCAALTEDGEGHCAIALPVGLAPGELLFELEAIGPTQARSELAELEVAVGFRPEVSLEATPSLLPQGGGQVVLVWNAPGATRATIRDDDGVVMLAGETSCGEAACEASGDEVALVTSRATEYLLIADNDFGRATATVTVRLEGAPRITTLTVDGVDVKSGPVRIGPSVTVAWQVENVSGADQVRLERAPSPGPDRGCAEVPVATWSLVTGFPKTGETAAAGSTTVSGLDDAATCLRFVAIDVDATPSQRDTAIALVYRAPEVVTFAIADQTLKAGDLAVLNWTTTRAYRVALEVSPVGAVTSQDLSACAQANGGCAVQIQPGTPLGDVTFSLTAIGERASRSAPWTVPVTVGVGPSIGAFSASPGSTSAKANVTLQWTSSLATELVIRNGASSVLTTTERSKMDAGSLVVNDVETTTTWELHVMNAFGEVRAQATTYVGPSIDALTVNGGDAKDGVEAVITGPVTVSWATTSADGSHRLETANVPANGNCAGATGWTSVYYRESPTPSASHSLGVVTSNRCVRLTVTNTQTPPQTGSATFLLRELPEIASLAMAPTALNGSGTVIVKMGVRGATALSVSAQYRNNSGEVLGTRSVCDQTRLNSGSLTGGATVDQVECAHQIVPCNLLCLNNGMPSGTTRVRYFVSVSDPEGDGANANTSGATDVVVQ